MLIKRNVTHGQHGSATYISWQRMLSRCLNPNEPSYSNYGGRGIKVCERWRDFDAFRTDMGERPKEMTLDRYPDVNGNYEPGNCRWATDVEQQNNTRTNVHLEHDGRTQTASQWSREVGVNVEAIYSRLKRGWSVERALTTQVRKISRSSHA